MAKSNWKDVLPAMGHMMGIYSDGKRPDYLHYPEESFIYLENKGNLKFADYSFPEAANGRWVAMDAGVMDADGDMDLVLGSFFYFLPAGDTTNLGNKWLTKGPSVIVLENTIR